MVFDVETQQLNIAIDSIFARTKVLIYANELRLPMLPCKTSTVTTSYAYSV